MPVAEPTLFPNPELPPVTQYPTLQLIKYMGSKREIIEFVAGTIDSLIAPGDAVLDLMAGTGSVGYALSEKHPVITNDIQEYSRVLSEALLRTTVQIPESKDVWKLLDAPFRNNRKALQRLLAPHLKREAEFIGTHVSASTVKSYSKFLDEYPHAGSLVHSATYNGLADKYSRLLKERSGNQGAVPYCLFTLYFGNGYFGLQQAIDFDSLRFAIDEVFTESNSTRAVALACLMHSASYCTPGPGHFAQFRSVNSTAVCQDILRYRLRSAKEYFLSKWEEFRDEHKRPQFENRCESLDYVAALDTHLDAVELVYLDPPYSFVHYSRFYHALETLVRYDYPDCTFNGRYRTDRHQSPFCIRTQVSSAFDVVLEKVKAKKKQLVISYSNTGMISLEELAKLCRDRFGKVEIHSNDYLHATMGRRGDRHRSVQEVLITCRS